MPKCPVSDISLQRPVSLILLKNIIGIQFIVATTQFINGNKMVDAFKDDIGCTLKQETLADII